MKDLFILLLIAIAAPVVGMGISLWMIGIIFSSFIMFPYWFLRELARKASLFRAWM